MHSTSTFSCSIGTTNANALLGVEIWFDNDQIYNVDHVDHTIDFCHEFFDVDGDHEIQFVMKNKTNDYTQVDESGAIIQDSCITIENFAIDGIDLGHTFFKQTKYHHDFNGTQDPIVDDFFGIMGCNGKVSFKFITPIYMWLLEHM